MPATTNLYQDLKDALQAVKDFLDKPEVAQVAQAIKAIGAFVPQVNELIGKLVTLLQQLKVEIDKLAAQAAGAIPGIDQFTNFTKVMVTALDTAKQLLPSQAGAINDVENIVSTASSLPTIGQVKDQIDSLIDAIVAHLQALQTA
jgi:ABC-type transporter Mla subunit MlaD